jgi:hypothetical protein
MSLNLIERLEKTRGDLLLLTRPISCSVCRGDRTGDKGFAVNLRRRAAPFHRFHIWNVLNLRSTSVMLRALLRLSVFRSLQQVPLNFNKYRLISFLLLWFSQFIHNSWVMVFGKICLWPICEQKTKYVCMCVIQRRWGSSTFSSLSILENNWCFMLLV